MITVNVVDALQISDFVERFKVKSTPTIVINEGMTIVGRITRMNWPAGSQRPVRKNR